MLALVNEQPIAAFQYQGDFGVAVYLDTAGDFAVRASQVTYRFIVWNRIEQLTGQFRVSSRFLSNLGNYMPYTEYERNQGKPYKTKGPGVFR